MGERSVKIQYFNRLQPRMLCCKPLGEQSVPFSRVPWEGNCSQHSQLSSSRVTSGQTLLGRGNADESVLGCLESGADLELDTRIPTKQHLSVTKPKPLSDFLLSKFGTVFVPIQQEKCLKRSLDCPFFLLLFLPQTSLKSKLSCRFGRSKGLSVLPAELHGDI